MTGSWTHPGRIVALLAGAVVLSGSATALDLGTFQATLFTPFLEWSVDNPSHTGNAFDVEATVTFTHPQSGTTHATSMFYDGGTTWRFRFTGTRTGTWSFSSSSSDPELDGLTGSVEVVPNPDPAVRGFIVASGTRFARQVDGDGALAGYLHNVFQDEANLRTSAMWSQGLSRWSDLALTHALLDQIEDNGMDTMEIELEHQVLKLDAARHIDHSSEEPDLTTFRIVEAMIALAHGRGHTVRLFMWGDESRKMTPVGLPGGINGFVDQRVQRYIGARLGPLPGWTLNYGFDLEEWVSEAEVGVWANTMHTNSGWRHLLAARRRSHVDVGLDANDERPERDFYDRAVSEIAASGGRPVVFDRRFIHLRDGVWDMETTRRALWQFTLAGGAGAVWGHEGVEYPNKEQLRTHFAFWHENGRFDLDLERAPAVSDGWALRSTSRERFAAYIEDATSIQLDLSGAPAPLAVIAVDTKLEHAPLTLGVLAPAAHTIALPYESDWAIAADPLAPTSVPALSPPAAVAAAVLVVLAFAVVSRRTGRP